MKLYLLVDSTKDMNKSLENQLRAATEVELGSLILSGRTCPQPQLGDRALRAPTPESVVSALLSGSVFSQPAVIFDPSLR